MDAYKKSVRKAIRLKEPLSSLPAENVPWSSTVCVCTRVINCAQVQLCNGESVRLTQSWATHLPDTTAEWAYKLWERNMREAYVRSTWGFDEKIKRTELMSPASR